MDDDKLTPNDKVYESAISIAEDMKEGYSSVCDDIQAYSLMFISMAEEYKMVQKNLVAYADLKHMSISEKMRYKKRKKTIRDLVRFCYKMNTILQLTSEDMVDGAIPFMKNPEISEVFNAEPSDEELRGIEAEEEDDDD